MSDEIQNNGSTRKYFATIPHMAGAKLDVYEYRLYGHYIEICGMSKTDRCTQAERTIYKSIGMSKQRFKKARRGLIDKGFITFRPGKPNKSGQKGYAALTTILDIWEENIKFCKSRPYTGQILPLQGVNNCPSKGSDITRIKNSNNSKKEKNIPPTSDGNASIEFNTSTHENTLQDYIDGEQCQDCHEIIHDGTCLCDGKLEDERDMPIDTHHCGGDKQLSKKEITTHLAKLVPVMYKYTNGMDSDLSTLGAYYYQGNLYSGFECPMCHDILGSDVWYLPLLQRAVCERCFGRMEDAETTGRTPRDSSKYRTCGKCKSFVYDGEACKCEQDSKTANLDANPTMAEVDAAIYGTRDNPVIPGDSIGEVVAPDEPPPAKTKKQRKPTAHTLMKNALVDAMGYTQDDITCWGDYNNASKKLRNANPPVKPDEVKSLHEFSTRLARQGKYTFKSPMQLAKDLPEYRKHQRNQEQLQAQSQDEQSPLDASQIIRYGEDYE